LSSPDFATISVAKSGLGWVFEYFATIFKRCKIFADFTTKQSFVVTIHILRHIKVLKYKQ